MAKGGGWGFGWIRSPSAKQHVDFHQAILPFPQLQVPCCALGAVTLWRSCFTVQQKSQLQL